MSGFIVRPTGGLSGRVCISGSKNAALPAMAAFLCTEERSVLHNVPGLADTENMAELIVALGGECETDKNGSCAICMKNFSCSEPPLTLAGKLRASFLLMAPLLARTGYVKIPIPGGCSIGARPVDLHLKGFAAMGAEIRENDGFVEARSNGLKGGVIYLDFPSVGATENILLGACLAKGKTHIENAAAEPEIFELICLLRKMGAKISTEKCGTIDIEGVDALHGCEHRVMPDRVETGTFMTAAAICRSQLVIENAIPTHVRSLTAKLREMGVPVFEDESTNTILVDKYDKIKNADIKTQPYPGFPTDMQAPFSVLMACANGTGMIVETIFENRFRHMPELARMGAKIKTEGRSAIVTGTKKLLGAKVRATDLRAGAALVLAALAADGESEIENIEYVERGYEKLDVKLNCLGARIERIQ